MQIPEFFLQRHSYFHQSFLPGLRKDLPEADFRKRPYPGTQPIVWLLWHIARVEDMGLSRLVWDKEQLYNEAWREKMNISLTHYGTSMTDDEVLQFAGEVNVYSVIDYLEAAGEQTRTEIAKLDLSKLDEILDEATVKRVVIDEGMGSENAEWVIPHYVGKPRGWILAHMGLTHSFRHFGQIMMVRKMLKARG